MEIPLSGLQLSDVITLFPGPQRSVNYIGSKPPTCTINLNGTGQVRIESNITPLVDGSSTIPNPNRWTPVRTIQNSGNTVIPLLATSGPNWIRVVVHGIGTGTCTISAQWSVPGDVIDPYKFLGLWNADTNTPTIQTGIGDRGSYYIVIAEGTTSINAISEWNVGDLIIFNGTAWVKQANDILNPV